MAETEPFFIVQKRIASRTDLSPFEKLAACLITALSQSGGGCTASNAYLAEYLGVSDRYIRETISSLTKKGVIKERANKLDPKRRLYPEPQFLASNPVNNKPGTIVPSPHGATVPGNQEQQFHQKQRESKIESKVIAPSGAASSLRSQEEENKSGQEPSLTPSQSGMQKVVTAPADEQLPPSPVIDPWRWDLSTHAALVEAFHKCGKERLLTEMNRRFCERRLQGLTAAELLALSEVRDAVETWFTGYYPLPQQP